MCVLILVSELIPKDLLTSLIIVSKNLYTHINHVVLLSTYIHVPIIAVVGTVTYINYDLTMIIILAIAYITPYTISMIIVKLCTAKTVSAPDHHQDLWVLVP